MQHAFSIWLFYFLLLQGMTYIAGAAAKFQPSGGIAEMLISENYLQQHRTKIVSHLSPDHVSPDLQQ